jgi:hypothetical protein
MRYPEEGIGTRGTRCLRRNGTDWFEPSCGALGAALGGLRNRKDGRKGEDRRRKIAWCRIGCTNKNLYLTTLSLTSVEHRHVR